MKLVKIRKINVVNTQCSTCKQYVLLTCLPTIHHIGIFVTSFWNDLLLGHNLKKKPRRFRRRKIFIDAFFYSQTTVETPNTPYFIKNTHHQRL